MNNIYVHLDGDKIGDIIELMLMDGRLDQACEFSLRVTKAMQKIKTEFDQEPSAFVHLAGGDDLIASFSAGALSLEWFNRIRESFHQVTGTTISCGLGSTPQEALGNLRRAKLSGQGLLIGTLK